MNVKQFAGEGAKLCAGIGQSRSQANGPFLTKTDIYHPRGAQVQLCYTKSKGGQSCRLKLVNYGAVLMAKKLRIHRLMEERPEMFDFGDIPAPRKKIPAQEARYDAMRPQWAKDLADGKK